jgi:hypothetical protein
MRQGDKGLNSKSKQDGVAGAVGMAIIGLFAIGLSGFILIGEPIYVAIAARGATLEWTARITRVDVWTSRDGRRGTGARTATTHKSAFISYTCNGIEYVDRLLTLTTPSMQQGQELKIYLDPEHPETFRVAKPLGDLFKENIIGALIFVVICILFIGVFVNMVLAEREE